VELGIGKFGRYSGLPIYVTAAIFQRMRDLKIKINIFLLTKKKIITYQKNPGRLRSIMNCERKKSDIKKSAIFRI
jgi:hypothetical protein